MIFLLYLSDSNWTAEIRGDEDRYPWYGLNSQTFKKGWWAWRDEARKTMAR